LPRNLVEFFSCLRKLDYYKIVASYKKYVKAQKNPAAFTVELRDFDAKWRYFASKLLLLDYELVAIDHIHTLR
jgi:hypothetical protein